MPNDVRSFLSYPILISFSFNVVMNFVLWAEMQLANYPSIITFLGGEILV